jgi:hypothetical protein
VRLGKPEWLGEFYSHSMLNRLSIFRLCQVKKIISAAKRATLQTDTKTQNGKFLESGSKNVE